jgi:hypothetical protein
LDETYPIRQELILDIPLWENVYFVDEFLPIDSYGKTSISLMDIIPLDESPFDLKVTTS